MKIQSAPNPNLRTLNTPEQPKPPAESPAPQDKVEITLPKKSSRYDAQQLIPRVVSGALRGLITTHASHGSLGWGAVYGAGTGMVGGAVTGAIATSRVAKKDGFPILGGVMGGVFGGGFGALNGAFAGPATVAITSYLGGGPLVGAAVGAALAAI